MRSTGWILLACFLIPVGMGALLWVTRYNQQIRELETLAADGVLAVYDGGTIGWDDLVSYIRTPPTEESRVLRSLQLTPEDVVGLESETPAFFRTPNGELLILRILKHIALLEWLHAEGTPDPERLQQSTEAYRNQLLIDAMEADFKPYTDEIPPEELLQYYVENSSVFFQNDKRLARHIMRLPSAATQSAGDPVWNALQNGEDFFQLTHLSESSSAEQNGRLDWLARGAVAQPFEDALWALDIGEITGPIEVRGTHHYIQLIDIQDEGLLSFEDSENEIRSILRSRKETEQRYAMLGLTANEDGLVDEQEYEAAMIRTALERQLDKTPRFQQKMEAFQWYFGADLLFEERMAEDDSGWFHENGDAVWGKESQTARRILSEINFQPTVRLDMPEPPSDDSA